ncbi:uncharacterized protein LOC134248784, partial [Saccostrea cucullata]|uniref:uncharacterized protein LOC134248784 n=1 Tax=Saccostrea cuccullata TaxID=36930 RepID=UPI002ED17AEE
SKNKSLKEYDCFVFAISSHGIEKEVKGKDQVVHHHAIQMFDDEFFDTQDVLDYFSPKACKALTNKPKLFFIQGLITAPDTKKGGGEPGHNKDGHDKIDYQDNEGISDEESDTEEGEVSDTDIEDSDLECDTDLPTTNSQDTDTREEQDTSDVEKYLEQRQIEIVRNLKKLQNEVWQLGRVYTQEANKKQILTKQQEGKGLYHLRWNKQRMSWIQQEESDYILQQRWECWEMTWIHLKRGDIGRRWPQSISRLSPVTTICSSCLHHHKECMLLGVKKMAATCCSSCMRL